MKFIKKLLRFLLLAGLVLGIGFLGLRFVLQPDYDLLTEVEISEMGSMNPVGTAYRLELREGVWVASRERIEWFKTTDYVQKQVGTYDVSELKDVLEDRWVCLWDKMEWFYNEMGTIVTDAETYRFRATFSDGTVLESEMYALVPDSFYDVWDAFEKLF